jgi:hypothetical protein
MLKKTVPASLTALALALPNVARRRARPGGQGWGHLAATSSSWAPRARSVRAGAARCRRLATPAPPRRSRHGVPWPSPSSPSSSTCSSSRLSSRQVVAPDRKLELRRKARGFLPGTGRAGASSV